MLRTVAIAFAIGLATVPAGAQGRYGNQGIPRGHLPPAGMCRVWYDNRPPGRQPPPVNCNDAERVASRDSNARVIYGTNSSYNNGRSAQYPGNGRYPDQGYGRYPDYGQYPNRSRGGSQYQSVPFGNGFDDGYEKGREDAEDRDRYDPTRHSRYRSADHEYNSRSGSKDQYRVIYRDGFRAGYDEAYRSFVRFSR